MRGLFRRSACVANQSGMLPTSSAESTRRKSGSASPIMPGKSAMPHRRGRDLHQVRPRILIEQVGPPEMMQERLTAVAVTDHAVHGLRRDPFIRP
jgi:hypothetical protein